MSKPKVWENIEIPETQFCSNAESFVTRKQLLGDLKGEVSSYLLKDINDFNLKIMPDFQAQAIQYLQKKIDIVISTRSGWNIELALALKLLESFFIIQCAREHRDYVCLNLSCSRYGYYAMYLPPEKNMSFMYPTSSGKWRNCNLWWRTTINIASREPNHLQFCGRVPYQLEGYLQELPPESHCLVVIEADLSNSNDLFRKEQVERILALLPNKNQQFIIFSVEGQKHVLRMQRMRNQRTVPIYLDILQDITHKSLERSYIVCPSADKKSSLLLTFLKKNANKKIIVVFGSCSLLYYYSAISYCIRTPLMAIYPEQSTNQNEQVISRFAQKERGILLCRYETARGLKFPAVDWIIHYSHTFRDPFLNYIDQIRNVHIVSNDITVGRELLILTANQAKAHLKILKQTRFISEKNEISLDSYSPDNDDEITFALENPVKVAVSNMTHNMGKFFKHIRWW